MIRDMMSSLGAEVSESTSGHHGIYLVSLGCSKNLVDSEAMSTILREEGYDIVSEPTCADVIIINTCGFIESAKKEAIDKILEMADRKHDFLIVTGCLAQRYAAEIAESLPEVDAILGTDEYAGIALAIKDLYAAESSKNYLQDVECGPLIRIGNENAMKHLKVSRTPSTKGYAYIKIAEGCSNNCAYCAIPGIRGRFVSRPLEDLVREAKYLASKGFYEIILIAQDTTRYGQDLYGERKLTELIRSISLVDGIRKIRLLYCYADGITQELIETMACEPKVAKYIDVPVQHISDNILKSMRRKDTSSSIEKCIRDLRDKVPGITIRTTVMVGFPGETDEDYDKLYDFVLRTRFDLLGCFIFSPEEGTAAYDMRNKVPAKVAKKRYNKLMELQRRISSENNKSRIGRVFKVTIDSPSLDGVFYSGRGDAQAPEIDPPIYVAASDEELEPGSEYLVRIVDHNDYEMTGVTCK
ncbi:MAG: 30S ribosomal protein S12 methylthiotransferase RimO [Eubacteriales bacterium]|nr:30S ribosomal protein S12 methylthiotransferase RimO [Eubacteriales bacterium]